MAAEIEPDSRPLAAPDRTALAVPESTALAVPESTPPAADENEPSVESAAGPDSLAPAAEADLRTVWRCSRGVITAVIVVMAVVGILVPAAAVLSLSLGLTALGDQQVLVLSVLGALGLLTLFFGWRLALHPRLAVDGDQLLVVNPFRRYRIDCADVTLLTPGENGLVIGTAEVEVEAWCVQKPQRAIRADRRTRADGICDVLWPICDRHRLPGLDPDGPVTIRYAHPGEEDLLAGLDRSATQRLRGDLLPAEEPDPEESRAHWRSVLLDRTKQTMIAELDGTPAGFVSHDADTILQLGVAEQCQRRGVGTALLEAAEDELFADPALPQIRLRVLAGNDVARRFCLEQGWQVVAEGSDTEGQADEDRADEDHADEDRGTPDLPEIVLTRRNPHQAKHSR